MPLVGEWQPPQLLSLLSPVNESNQSSCPTSATRGSIGRPSRATSDWPTVPLNPVSRRVWLSRWLVLAFAIASVGPRSDGALASSPAQAMTSRLPNSTTTAKARRRGRIGVIMLPSLGRKNLGRDGAGLRVGSSKPLAMRPNA